MSKQCYAVITTVNEAKTIGGLVAGLHSLGLHCVVFDDCSVDGTATVAEAAGAFVERNLDLPRIGIGPGLMMGWRAALSFGADCVLQIDAGGSHDWAQAPRLLKALGNGADVVIGSRFCKGGRYVGGCLLRQLGSRLAAHMCNNRVVKPRFTDWTSGYRAFTADAIDILWRNDYHTTMHSWQIEVLAMAIRAGLRIAEVPITYHAGRSSMNRQIARDAVHAWSLL